MKISAAFPPVPATPEHIALAEMLGYSTAWVYDTPALQLDCWMTLALAAARTRRIRLGPGVMIPSLRHPMVTASAIATLVSLVGESRVVVGVGAGFTVTDIMGPSGWHDWHAARAVALAPSRDVGQQQNERRLGNGRRHCFVLARRVLKAHHDQ